MFCVRCGSQLQANARFCTICGADNSTFAPSVVPAPPSGQGFIEKPEFCIKCGTELYPNTKVCPNCRFDNTSYIAPPPAPQQFQPSPGLLYPAGPAYSEGDILVVPRNATLPAACVKCGGVPKERWLRGNYRWHRPIFYLLLFLGLLVYVIVSLIVGKSMQLLVPICDKHNSERKTKLWMGALLLLGFIPLPVVLAATWQNENAGWIAFLLGFVMFMGGLVMIWLSYPLRPIYIGDDCAKFKGAHPDFLARLSTPPVPGMGVQAQSSGF